MCRAVEGLNSDGKRRKRDRRTDEEALADMREHRRTVPQCAAFVDPAMHVAYANHRRHDARFAYLPGGGGELSSFECLLCDPPQRFLLGRVLNSAIRNPSGAGCARTRCLPTKSPHARFLEELTGPVIEAYVHGEIRAWAALLAGCASKGSASSPQRPRPIDAAREDGCMQFFPSNGASKA